MKRLLFPLLFLCLLSNVQGQIIPVGSLWQASTVYDTLGKKYMNQIVEEFIYFESETHFLHLKVSELMDNNTKEAIISYSMIGNTFKKKGNVFNILAMYNHDFQILNPDSIFYKSPMYGLAFRRIKTGIPRFNAGFLKSFLLAGKITPVILDPVQKKEFPSGVTLTYQTNGQVNVQKDPTKEGVKTDYRIINFGQYIILKGVNSFPFVAEQIVKGKLIGLELENRRPVRLKEFRIME